MGFKDGAKEPLMHEAPDNKDTFADTYTNAANAIGCTLKIVRYSKHRVPLALSLVLLFTTGYSTCEDALAQAIN